MAPITPMIERFETLSDLRSTIHITYSLPEVLFIVYASILSGYEEWESMENFANYNVSWFRQFFPYRWGMPSYHTIESVCMMIEPKEFINLFVEWMGNVITALNHKEGKTEQSADDIIAIDGKGH